MRTKNFFKGLAVAAVALVGVFATSCSEEELNLNGTINGTPVDPVTPTELPDGVAYAAISVVDLGDLGEAPEVLYSDAYKVANGDVIACPEFPKAAEYVIPAAQTITVPTLEKGQTITIPVTFYVVKTTSAFAAVKWTPNAPKEEGLNPDATNGLFVLGNEPAQVISGLDDKRFRNESDYWKDIFAEYKVPAAGQFVRIIGDEAEAPEGGEGEGEGTEGEGGEGEGTEGEEGGEGEGTEGEEGGEGEGDATEGEVVLSFDFEDGKANFFSWNLTSVEAAEGACKAVVPEAKNTYDAQLAYDVTTPFTLDQEYKVVFKVKGSAEGKADLVFQTPSQDLGWPVAGSFGEFNITTDWTDVELSTTCTRDDATRLIFSFGTWFVGDLYIDDFQLIAVAPAAKAATLEETTNEDVIMAYAKSLVAAELKLEEQAQKTEVVTLFSWSYTTFTKTIYTTQPTFAFEYNGTTLDVQFEEINNTVGELSKPEAIPGHEAAFEHSHGHGGYEHGHGHGDNSNAGGGISTWE